MHMKKTLLAIAFMLVMALHAMGQSSLPISVFAFSHTSDMCGMGVGIAGVDIIGGSPPYTYLWDNGATTELLSGLSTGSYTVTVTDNTAASASSQVLLSNFPIPDLNVGFIGLPSAGMADGVISFFVYSFGMYMPDATYTFDLYDSASVNVYNETVPCVQCNNPLSRSVGNLGAGNYHLTVTTSFGCSAYIDFTLTEMPLLNPSYTTIPSCNGAPDGTIILNSHPSPSIDSLTFKVYADIQAHPPAGYMVSMYGYSGIVYDSSGAAVDYMQSSDSIFTSSVLAPGNYIYKIYQRAVQMDSTLVSSTPFTITTDTTCSLVTGMLYADFNGDCVYNGTDIPLKNAVITLNPGPFYGVTNSSGNYFIPVTPGSYTLQQNTPFPAIQLCPNPGTFVINISQGQVVIADIADSITGQPDVQVGLASVTQPRPGFIHKYKIEYKNISPFPIPASVLTFTYDSMLVPGVINPPQTNGSLGQLSWNVDGMAPFEEKSYLITTTVPVSALIGTLLSAVATATPALNEVILQNNSDSIGQLVTGSFDPNDITVSPAGYGPQGYVSDLTDLAYTVRFQNTGNDTAFTVAIHDVLPAGVNIASVQVLASSHDYIYELNAGNELVFFFDNILLPDSNTDEEGSHGMIKFRLSQQSGNVQGTLLQNQAGIVFDFNQPVITNQVTNTVFECSQMSSASISKTTFCENDTADAVAILLFAMNTEWYLDNIFLSAAGSVLLQNIPSGTHQLMLTASNEMCSYSSAISIQVEAMPAEPVISVNGNLLSSSGTGPYQWYLNGTADTLTASPSFTPNQTGWYQVMVTNAASCTAISDSVFVTVTAIYDGQDAFNRMIVLPNPAREAISVYSSAIKGNCEIEIINSLGKVCYKSSLTKSGQIIDITTFSKGFYFVRISTESSIFHGKFLKE